VKKYHLYYSLPTYAAGFTYIFCHLPSVHWYFVKSRVYEGLHGWHGNISWIRKIKSYRLLLAMVIYLESGRPRPADWCLPEWTEEDWGFSGIPISYIVVGPGHDDLKSKLMG
jgi:hypothetical protein